MAKMMHGKDVFKALMRLLPGMPQRVTELTLHVSLDEIPRLTVTFFPEVDTDAVTDEFDIVKRIDGDKIGE